jgi:hypothetical protein
MNKLQVLGRKGIVFKDKSEENINPLAEFQLAYLA